VKDKLLSKTGNFVNIQKHSLDL